MGRFTAITKKFTRSVQPPNNHTRVKNAISCTASERVQWLTYLHKIICKFYRGLGTKRRQHPLKNRRPWDIQYLSTLHDLKRGICSCILLQFWICFHCLDNPHTWTVCNFALWHHSTSEEQYLGKDPCPYEEHNYPLLLKQSMWWRGKQTGMLLVILSFTQSCHKCGQFNVECSYCFLVHSNILGKSAAICYTMSVCLSVCPVCLSTCNSIQNCWGKNIVNAS